MARHVFKGKSISAILPPSSRHQCWRRRQRCWRHHHDDDVDRRHQPFTRVRSLCRGHSGISDFRHSCRVPAACHSPIIKHASRGLHIEWTFRLVAAILVIAITANVIANLKFPAVLDVVPVIGLAVWIVIFVTAPLRARLGNHARDFKGTIFLLALVTNASFMPVEQLPAASWQTALGLGFLSSVFDNIPLTALALKQGGYDWGFLAYAVGFRRLDDLVRVVSGRRDRQHVSGSEIGRPVAAARLVYRSVVCCGLLCYVRDCWLAS